MTRLFSKIFSIPSERHETVPWTGFDVLLLFALYLMLGQLCVQASLSLAGVQAKNHAAERTVVSPEIGRKAPEHPLTRLFLGGKRSAAVFGLVLLLSVVLAPVTEEFLFRLVLQRWIEKKTIGLRNTFPDSRPPLSPGPVSVVTASLVFALVHIRGPSEPDADFLFYGLFGLGAANLATVALGTIYLVVQCKATRYDLGFPPSPFSRDLRTAGAALLLTVPGIFALHYLLRLFFPEIATDPVPLFFFAIVLGTVLYRTGRLLPCILLHAALNSLSFSMLVFSR